ncbi:NAD(P)-dependent oxidoreductase [Alsobacter sp. R-9]
MQVAICGTGKMGSAMAERLLSQGHAVTVWNRDRAKLGRLTALGAVAAATPAEAAGSAEAVITMVLDEAAIDAVYRGPDGILSGAIRGRLVVDMSTVLPATSARLAADVAAAGADFVECPVGGSVGPAKNGQLLGLVGGSDAAVARARPILETLCRRVEHVGPAGAGAKLKLAVNLPLIVYWQALGEAMSLLKTLDLPPERIVDILSDTSGTPAAMKLRGPDIARRLGGAAPSAAAFDMGAARKDLALMTRFATSQGDRIPVTEAALAAYVGALAAGVPTTDDATAVAVLLAGKGDRP